MKGTTSLWLDSRNADVSSSHLRLTPLPRSSFQMLAPEIGLDVKLEKSSGAQPVKPESGPGLVGLLVQRGAELRANNHDRRIHLFGQVVPPTDAFELAQVPGQGPVIAL